MTPQQKATLDRLVLGARRIGITGSLVIGAGSAALSWGFRKYDDTNVSATAFRSYRDSVAKADTIYKLGINFELTRFSAQQLRTDSAVRKICAVVVRGPC